MRSRWKNGVVTTGQLSLALVFLALTPLYATVVVAGILWGLNRILGLGTGLSGLGWLVVSPIVYITWLNTFLIACAIDVQAWRVLFGFRKPRRAATSEGFSAWLQFHLAVATYLRQRVIWSLPLTQAYLVTPGLRTLVLLSSSPRISLGRGCAVLGTIFDPDLTEIGENAIIGAGSAIVAHTVTTTTQGDRVLSTAPIVIGARAVIGGLAHINPGVRIGADALVEPGSYVPAFTGIGDGEVWGGNPARFLRHRSESTKTTPDRTSELASHADRDASWDEAALRHVVATALDLTVSDIPADFQSCDCSAWDSLGQLAIAAGLHDRFGVLISAERGFQLKSLADLRQLLSEQAAESPVIELSDESLPHDPELLPLLDHERVTRALSGRASTTVAKHEPVSVVIAATFVAEPIASTLKTWCRAFGIPIELRFAGFNQVQQCLMTPGSEFQQNRNGLNIVLARPEDLLSARAESESSADSLLSAIADFAKSAPGTLVVGTLPPVVSTFCSASRAAVATLRTTWRERLSQIDGLRILEVSDLIEQIGVAAAGRADLEVVARSPYTPRVVQELGIAIARLVRQQRVAPAKVIALDADGILWGGVLGEDGLDGIQLGPDHPGRGFQLLQQQVLDLKRRGCLLVLVSRNEAADVWRVFDEHPEMVLRRQDITAARINWSPKSQNLRELAAELNLGLDSFVFLDDDPANHAEVSANAPGVTIVPMPSDSTLFCQTLSRLWRFDAPQLTAEDQNRAEMMHAERQRQQQLDSTIDLGSYLKSLQLRVSMRVARDAELPRVSQLTQKTNQFNTSLKRRSLAEIQTLAKSHSIFVVEASDRFGDYGLIGVAILARCADNSTDFTLDTLLMSCRALGRGIEDAVLFGLSSVVTAEGGSRLLVGCVDGPRNQPCREYLTRTMSGAGSPGEFVCSRLADRTLPTHIEWQEPPSLAERRAA